jgi:hypothetical protein
VRAQDDAALEAEHEILADGLDRLEPSSVELLGDTLGLGARVRRFDFEGLADQHLEPARGSMERVPLRHRWSADSLVGLV